MDLNFIPDFIINPLLLIIGFVLLIIGADKLVDGASSIAKKYGISSLVIGLTIVAFGTSAPELVVSLMSIINDNTESIEIAISNIIGSNISNILLILGVTAIVYPISIPKSSIRNEIPFIIFIGALLILLLNDNILGILDSTILLIFFAGFMYYTYKIAKKENENNKKDNEEEIKILSNIKATLFIILGLTGLIVGGKMIVSGAVNIAENYGLSKSFIGVTIIAIGTSLPELAASMVAAFKKNTDMAIGGVIGSNIFNVLWILGISSLIYPLPGYGEAMKFDLIINLIVSLMIFLAAFTFKKNLIERKEGVVLFIAYICYISYLIYNVI